MDEAGVMMMEKLDGIDLAPSSTIELNAGGLHIMMLDLTAPLVEGSTFDVTLDFEKAADAVVPVTVTAAGMAMDGHDGHDMATPESAPTTEGAVEEAPATETIPSAEPSTDEIPAIIEETMPDAASEAPAETTDEKPAY
jgi:hypothetical protein